MEVCKRHLPAELQSGAWETFPVINKEMFMYDGRTDKQMVLRNYARLTPPPGTHRHAYTDAHTDKFITIMTQAKAANPGERR